MLGKRHVVELVLTADAERRSRAAGGRAGHRQDLPRRARWGSRCRAPNTRIQFTPDLLPERHHRASASTTRRKACSSSTRARSSPTSCSPTRSTARAPRPSPALLEVMEEGSVTIDGVTRQVGRAVPRARHPEPRRAGRHLPPARGAARPLHDAHVARLPRPRRDASASSTAPAIATADLTADHHPAGPAWAWRTWRARVYVDALVLDYIARLVDGTRTADEVRLGVSIRGALALTRAARTRAASQGRTYATPDDVKTLAVPRALAPPDPPPRGRVRRRHPGGRGRPGAARRGAARRDAKRYEPPERPSGDPARSSRASPARCRPPGPRAART